MKRWAGIGVLTACVALAFGCEQQTEVQRQTRDLQEAQKSVAKVTKELEGQLEQAKADVVRLEQKLALARQGLTDDVLENQKELQAALQAQERKVESELGDAKREAQIHARDTEAALKTLGQAEPTPADPAASATPSEATPPAAPPATDAPREDLVPVKGADTESDTMPDPDPVAPPAPPQPTSPVTDPTGAVPPLPPPAAAPRNVAPSDPPPTADPGHPAPTQP